MEKMRMETKNLAEENYKKLYEMFPNVFSETVIDGKTVRTVDAEALAREINTEISDNTKEKYVFSWPEKSKTIAQANLPTDKTLRPKREESKDFDTTENLYIKGDNLEVLKILRETYLGRIKMIYIDPPYNTGNDFVYNDNFAMDKAEFDEASGLMDEEGNRLFKNTESNGRYHTDWLNMIYPRLKFARDLLTDDGVIFISIDDNEVSNLKKICDEIFGESNFVANLIRKTVTQRAMAKNYNCQHENCLLYVKNMDLLDISGNEKTFDDYSNPDNDPNGEWKIADPTMRGNSNTYAIRNPYTNKIDTPPIGRGWAFSEDKINDLVNANRLIFKKDYTSNERGFYLKRYKSELKSNYLLVNSLDFCNNDNLNLIANKEIVSLFDNLCFDYPKPSCFIKKLISYKKDNNCYILDFFSGSATTAHAVMELNGEDGGKRKFIMVQLPEKCEEDSEAYKAGYKNICEIGMERIRRAGNKIKEENPMTTGDLDTGFRVLELDSSNMTDSYFTPDKYSQETMGELSDNNIKFDRTAEDLLFSVMNELGILLSSPIEKENIQGVDVYNVNYGQLMFVYDMDLPENIITEIAKKQPRDFVMVSPQGEKADSLLTSAEQLFKYYSKDTNLRII